MHTNQYLPPPSIIADFLIIRDPAGGFAVAVRGFGSARFPAADLADPDACAKFIRAIGERFPDLQHGGAPEALARAMRELAGGQPCAGKSVDDIRVSVRELRARLMKDPEPKAEAVKRKPTKAERIRKMNCQLAEVGQ